MLMPRQKTPSLTVETVTGETFDLASEGSERGTVVCFYRGLHCPICANYLTELEKRTPEFAERGVGTIAISSDDKERGQGMADKIDLAKTELAEKIIVIDDEIVDAVQVAQLVGLVGTRMGRRVDATVFRQRVETRVPFLAQQAVQEDDRRTLALDEHRVGFELT